MAQFKSLQWWHLDLVVIFSAPREFQCVLKTGSYDALVYKYNFSKGDYNEIRSVLNEINWDNVFDSKVL